MNVDNKLVSIFGGIEDPRSYINQSYNLVDVLLIGIISVICGAETWKQMVEFAFSKEKFLRKFLDLPWVRNFSLINTTAWYCIRSYPIRIECVSKTDVFLPKVDSLLHFVSQRNDTVF